MSSFCTCLEWVFFQFILLQNNQTYMWWKLCCVHPGRVSCGRVIQGWQARCPTVSQPHGWIPLRLQWPIDPILAHRGLNMVVLNMGDSETFHWACLFLSGLCFFLSSFSSSITATSETEFFLCLREITHAELCPEHCFSCLFSFFVIFWSRHNRAVVFVWGFWFRQCRMYWSCVGGQTHSKIKKKLFSILWPELATQMTHMFITPRGPGTNFSSTAMSKWCTQCNSEFCCSCLAKWRDLIGSHCDLLPINLWAKHRVLAL